MAVTLDDVKCIIALDPEVTDACWQALLDDAAAWVLSLGIETECGAVSSDAVTKYLAAHLMTIRDPRQTQQATLDASESFSDNTGSGLDGSEYGQMAKRMDCTGQLNDLDDEAENGTKKVRHIFSACGR